MSFCSRALPFLLLVGFAQGCGGASRSPGYGGYLPRASPKQVSLDSTTATSTYSAASGGDADEVAESARAEAPSPPPPPAQAPLAQAAPTATSAQLDAKPEPPKEGGKGEQAVLDKRAPILIYTATFSMAVFEVNNSLIEVERLAREVGGFVTKRTDRLITIRVPAPRFYESVGRIEKLGDMTQRDVVAQDVTEEFLDTEIRLRNARAVRDRLAQLLARASTVQDSLMIERELNRVASEIDRLEGRLKYLRDRAAFSTITVSFDARRTVAPPPSVRLPFPWLNTSGLSRLLSL